MLGQLLIELLHHHRGKIFGIALGLTFGLLVIFIGFLQTVFIACCIFIGYIIGKRIDDNEGFRELMDKIFKDR